MQTTGQHSYVGNTMNTNDKFFKQVADNFAAAHNATQVTIQQLVQQNAQLQSTIPAMQQQMAFMTQQLQMQDYRPSMLYQQNFQQPQQQW